MTNEEILRAWYTDVWERGDLGAIDRMFHPDTDADGLLPDLEMGPEEFKIVVSAIHELVNPPRIEIVKTIAQGDWLAALMTAETIAKDGGQPVKTQAMVLARFEGGLIVEAYNSFDFLGFFAQLGYLPPDTIELCLSGARLS